MIQIYIQELATYNNAVGVGKWINVEDFDSEIEVLFEEATEVLKSEDLHYGVDAEEYEIVDWECEVDIDLKNIYQDIDKLKTLNELLLELDQNEIDKLGYLMDIGCDITDITVDTIDNVYSNESWDEAIEEFIEYGLDIPMESMVNSYLDYDKIQRDLEIDGYTEYNGKVYREA
jgi:antirestriction protein